MGKKEKSVSSSSESEPDIEEMPKAKSRKSKESKKSKEFKESKPSKKSKKIKSSTFVKKIPFSGLIIFSLVWLAIYYEVVLRYANKLPASLTIDSESLNKNQFIAERAEQLLSSYEAIGPKVAGSAANEVGTVNFLMSAIKNVRTAMNTSLFKLEVDLQQASGAYIHWEMVNMYQGVQNVVVKLSPLSSQSSSYLLINTHFDSKPGSPGSGDPGAMVVVMLEVMRVIATGNEMFSHPIVFLFNGAEENPLQGSHAFITQHQWAKNCKAFINLDSAGSGNRDLMFRSDPQSPWLMEYYKDYAVHPYATVAAEELFQLGIIPSDTDFSIFTKYSSVRGVDIAHTRNGYVYHTKWDRMDVISGETLQNTGDNILSLAKGLANAAELVNPSLYASESVVFYDLLGQYLVFYTTAQATQINYGVSLAAALTVFLSICCMSANSRVTFVGVVGRFILTSIIQLISLAAATVLPVGLAVLLDKQGVPLSYFTCKWMVVGLFFCPFISGLGLPTATLLEIMKKDKLTLHFRVQLILNSQVLVVAFLCAAATFIGIKSAYLFMLATLLFSASSLFNILTTLYRTGFAWFFVTLLFQIPAFVYFTYIGYISYNSLIPMLGRIGAYENPDLYVAGLAALIGILSLGFIVPLVSLFRKPERFLLGLLAIAAAFVGIAMSSIGFPFRPKTNVERFDVIHTQRVFYEANKTVSLNESGYYFYPQDRRMFNDVSDAVDTSKVISMESQCYEYMFCGLPVYNHRWNRARTEAKWLPSGPAVMPSTINLTMYCRQTDPVFQTIRFYFELDGPPHMGIYIGPLPGAKVRSWSFLDTMLVEKWAPPYFIYFAKANDQSPLKFHVTFEKSAETLYNSTFELGIGAHFVSAENERSATNAAFLAKFPDHTFLTEWPAIYERRIF